jgi:hypothetical protein
MTSNPKLTDKAPVIPKNTIITLQLAVIRVKRWLNAMKTIPAFAKNPSSIPRALFISRNDLLQMLADCDKEYPDYEITGVRVYFAIAGEDKPEPPSTCDMRGLLVPVMELKMGDKQQHKDLVHKSMSNPDPNDTSIYDFTTPCPDYCDQASELYINL